VKALGVDYIGIFILPPSFEVLERRLRGRSADSEDSIQQRLKTARREVLHYAEYEFVVINDQLESATVRLQEIIAAARSRAPRMQALALKIIDTFHG
jgi:guanylate kinase